MSYLTPEEAHDRLLLFEIDALPTEGALAMASRRLDISGPFYGTRAEYGQEHAFPRSFTAEGDVDGEVPDAVLDWVALEANRLTVSTGGETGDAPPISSISHPAAGSVSYARPKISNQAFLQRGLLRRYQRPTGVVR